MQVRGPERDGPGHGLWGIIGGRLPPRRALLKKT